MPAGGIAGIEVEVEEVEEGIVVRTEFKAAAFFAGGQETPLADARAEAEVQSERVLVLPRRAEGGGAEREGAEEASIEKKKKRGAQPLPFFFLEVEEEGRTAPWFFSLFSKSRSDK